MPQTTSSPSISSIIARYNESFLEGAKAPMLYSQSAVDYTNFAPGMTMDQMMRASTVYIPVQSGMSIGTSTLSQTSDLTPQSIYDATVSIDKTSRGEALQFSQQLKIEAFDEFTANFFKIIGENCMESIEARAIDVALAGTFYDRPASTRLLMDAGTSAHNASDAVFRRAAGLFAACMFLGSRVRPVPNGHATPTRGYPMTSRKAGKLCTSASIRTRPSR